MGIPNWHSVKHVFITCGKRTYWLGISDKWPNSSKSELLPGSAAYLLN